MDQKQFKAMFQELKEGAVRFHSDLQKYHLRINASKRTLGSCNRRERLITVSKWHIQGSSEDSLRDTILHEFAHALAYARHGNKAWNHGPLWKEACGDLGANPNRISYQAYDVERPPAKYTLRCPQCGIEDRRHRMSRGAKYSCVRCGSEIEIIQHW